MARSSTTGARKPAPVKQEGAIRIEYLRLNEDEPFFEPDRQYPGDVGLDLTVTRYTTIHPDHKASLPTNIAMAIPQGYAGLILPRSSTFSNKGLVVHPGLIDSGYRGEVQILVHNPGKRTVQVQVEDRLAQLIIIPVIPVEFEQQEKDLPAGDRKLMGFGSTGGHGSPRINP